MTLNVNGYNSTFKKFADFATQSIEEGNKKAIANAAMEKTAGGRKKFVVVASTSDKVGDFLFRLPEERSANDATRNIFLKSVSDMFGGVDKIPPKVLKAIKLEDYNFGSPLTARRIMAVKVAIDNYRAAENGGLESPAQTGRQLMKDVTASKTAAVKKAKGIDPDMKPLKIDKALATKMIGDSCKLMNVELSDENMDFAVEMLRRYGNKLPAKNARVLSNFIVNTGANEGMDEEAIENIAKDIKEWKEFDFGDPRLAKLSKKFVQRQNTYANDVITNESLFSTENPDVFQQVAGDADRGDWNINGKTYKKGTEPKVIVGAFMSAIKKPNARKVVSSILNQGNLADLETLFFKSGALVGDAKAAKIKEEFLYKLPGGKMFVSRNAARDNGIGITADANVRYGLSVSTDGKMATVTVSIDKHLSTIGVKHDDYKIGFATITQQTTVDLTKDMPEIIDVTFSQTYTPDKIEWTGMHS